MKVQELIKILSALPHDSTVSVFWDGGARGGVEGVVNNHDEKEVVIVSEWSFYRKEKYRAYPEEIIVYG